MVTNQGLAADFNIQGALGGIDEEHTLIVEAGSHLRPL
jgi:hypothetical protein